MACGKPYAGIPSSQLPYTHSIEVKPNDPILDELNTAKVSVTHVHCMSSDNN